MVAQEGLLTVKNSQITNNSSDFAGGGLMNKNGTNDSSYRPSKITFEGDNTVSGNTDK